MKQIWTVEFCLSCSLLWNSFFYLRRFDSALLHVAISDNILSILFSVGLGSSGRQQATFVFRILLFQCSPVTWLLFKIHRGLKKNWTSDLLKKPLVSLTQHMPVEEFLWIASRTQNMWVLNENSYYIWLIAFSHMDLYLMLSRHTYLFTSIEFLASLQFVMDILVQGIGQFRGFYSVIWKFRLVWTIWIRLSISSFDLMSSLSG